MTDPTSELLACPFCGFASNRASESETAGMLRWCSPMTGKGVDSRAQWNRRAAISPEREAFVAAAMEVTATFSKYDYRDTENYRDMVKRLGNSTYTTGPMERLIDAYRAMVQSQGKK